LYNVYHVAVQMHFHKNCS